MISLNYDVFEDSETLENQKYNKVTLGYPGSLV